MRERVSAFVDGEVSEMEMVAVRRHLEGCTTCRDFVAFSRGAQRTIRRMGLDLDGAVRPVSVSPIQLSSAVRAGRHARGGVHRAILGLAAALMVGVLTGAIGMEVAIRESRSTPPPVIEYEAKIVPGKPLQLDYIRSFETAPKPAMVFPVIRVIEPLPPDPSWRWAGLDSGESYPEGYKLELVRY